MRKVRVIDAKLNETVLERYNELFVTVRFEYRGKRYECLYTNYQWKGYGWDCKEVRSDWNCSTSIQWHIQEELMEQLFPEVLKELETYNQFRLRMMFEKELNTYGRKI
jgi:hypothetical protein